MQLHLSEMFNILLYELLLITLCIFKVNVSNLQRFPFYQYSSNWYSQFSAHIQIYRIFLSTSSVFCYAYYLSQICNTNIGNSDAASFVRNVQYFTV